MDLLSGLSNLQVNTNENFRPIDDAMDVDMDVDMDRDSDVDMDDYVVIDQQEKEPAEMERQSEEAAKKEAENSDTSDINEAADSSFQTDAKALVHALLSPESQGFKLATKSNSEVLQSKQGNYIIHNHYYNNVFAYPGQVGNSFDVQNRISDEDYEKNENKAAGLDLNENEPHNSQIYQQHSSSSQKDNTFLVLNLLKSSLNYGILVFFILLLFKNIKSDIRNEYNKLEQIKNLKIDQCKMDYFKNKCDEYGQLPALKELCLNWSLCFSDEFHPDDTTFYTELAFKVIGALINGFLENIGNLNKLFLASLVFIWYFGNFLCGYYKGNNSAHDRLDRHWSVDSRSNEMVLKKYQ